MKIWPSTIVGMCAMLVGIVLTFSTGANNAVGPLTPLIICPLWFTFGVAVYLGGMKDVGK